MSAIPGLSLLNFDPPASCSTGQRICIFNDVQIPHLKALHCGLDERIPVLSLSLLSVLSDIIYSLRCSQHRWHLSLPVELQNNVDELMSFFSRLSGLCFWTGWCVTQNNGLFVSRQEITSLFCLCSILGLWNLSVDTIIWVLTETRMKPFYWACMHAAHDTESWSLHAHLIFELQVIFSFHVGGCGSGAL